MHRLFSSKKKNSYQTLEQEENPELPTSPKLTAEELAAYQAYLKTSKDRNKKRQSTTIASLNKASSQMQDFIESNQKAIDSLNAVKSNLEEIKIDLKKQRER